MRWDVFCRVIDNHGDLGVCWRLARDLAARGETIRLWIDDPSALAWMAPRGATGVEVIPWAEAAPLPPPQDVVVEAFGCDPPAAFVAAMAARPRPPVWINLEYLSAEDYVERSHGLPSPQFAGPGRGLVKWFFYPGFTPRTGGLLCEPGLLAARAAFDRDAWLGSQGLAPPAGERLVSLFAYEARALPALLAALGDAPTWLLAAPGASQQALATLPRPPAVRWQPLPWLAQDDYDRLLWSCDLNLVRGEDSFVRAQWAGAPFLWHIYPQHDGAHHAKLEAFLARFAAAAPAGASPVTDAVAEAMRQWNADRAPGRLHLPDLAAWRAACEAWRAELAAQPDLTTQLLAFVATRSAAC